MALVTHHLRGTRVAVPCVPGAESCPGASFPASGGDSAGAWPCFSPACALSPPHPAETQVGWEPSWVRGGERSCTKASGIAEPSRDQLCRGAVGLCEGREAKQPQQSEPACGWGAGGSQRARGARLARGPGLSAMPGGLGVSVPTSTGQRCCWGTWEEGAGRGFWPCVGIIGAEMSPPDPASGSSSSELQLDPLQTITALRPQHLPGDLLDPQKQSCPLARQWSQLLAIRPISTQNKGWAQCCSWP